MSAINYNADKLAFAVLEQACRDATGAHGYHARAWLLSDESNWLLEPLGWDVRIRQWVNNGCKLASGRWGRIDKQNDRDWTKYYENSREK